MDSIGLVLEGGGMRGVYTAGVLEYFAEKNLYFPYNIGVSAGACNAASYLSRQQGRNKIVTIDYVTDPRYLSLRNLWKKRELFGMDFIFDEIPNSLVPFDYETFHAAKEEYVIGTTDCETGQPRYYSNRERDFDALTILRASSSLPFIAPVITYKGVPLMDGGISDPIPIRKAEADGNPKNVLVLTRNKGYVKKPASFPRVSKRAYRKYPRFVDTMLDRHERYNETIQYIEEQEQKGFVFVIRPKEPLVVGRVERNKDKLLHLYNQGYQDAKQLEPALREWLSGV